MYCTGCEPDAVDEEVSSSQFNGCRLQQQQ